jgi:hypothetical protein
VNQVTGQAATYSQPYVINQPQVWWTDQNNSYVGGKVSVFGTNLSYGDSLQPYSDQSWVYLFPSNSDGVFNESSAPIVLPLTAVAPDAINGSGAMDVNPYKVDFSLPASVQGGQYYQVEIYNGHGGIYGLSAAVAGSGSGSLIYVAPALSLSTVSPLPLSVAYKYWSGTPANCPLYLDTDDTQINPAAVNYAIDWANWYASNPAAANGGGGSLSYFAIQLPVGTINITDATDIIQMEPYVHLIGAGDTGNPLTGTVVEADAGAGGALQGLVELPAYGNPPPAGENMALTDMYLCANGQVSNYDEPWGGGGVIFCEANISGLTFERLTIDATTDDPANPYTTDDTAPDIWINDGLDNTSLSDSTLIGSGITCDANNVTVDNCHFIGCGAPTAQFFSQYTDNLSIVRSTDTSLVNNVISPGGNVEYDAASRLVSSTQTVGGIYVGESVATDMYPVPELGSQLNGGEVISIEPQNTTRNVAVFQNILAGDGAESLLGNSSGITVQGDNIVVTDNDISNLEQGIHIYNAGYDSDISFGIYSDNSIHNVDQGIWIQAYSAVSNAPLLYCNLFSGNDINGIISSANGESKVGGWAGNSGAILITYGPEDTSPPQDLMNIFSANEVTGAGTLLCLDGVSGFPLGTTVITDSFFGSDGGYGSNEENNLTGDSSLIIAEGNISQGYWLTGL